MTPMNRRAFLQHVVAGGALAGLVPACGPAARRSAPNLLFIMADDLGYGDLSLTGRTDYQTPVLDALAHQGTVLTQAYAAAPVCTPTRVALMTGRYPARTRPGSRAAAWIYMQRSAPASGRVLPIASGKPHLGYARTGVEKVKVPRSS
jgi:hypothetical protein